jgi:dihydroorotate dehydrogenase (fumarate)
MPNLSTSYMGLKLANPFIAGASGYGRNLDGVLMLRDAGASAVVLKSLFEEQVRLDMADSARAMEGAAHPEAYEYLQADYAAQFGPRAYLRLVEQAATKANVPIIASINCVSPGSWTTFARQIQEAGASALEMNIYHLPVNTGRSSADLEAAYVAPVKQVTSELKIPVAVKLIPAFTNIGALAIKVSDAGASGLVLFNRFFHPDIDISGTPSYGGSPAYSAPSDFRPTLRWTALLSGRTPCDICASGGIHAADSAIKMLLAGANAVQVVSAIYIHGTGRLRKLIDGLDGWMREQGHANLEDFRGSLSWARAENPDLLLRAQYIKAFVGVE